MINPNRPYQDRRKIFRKIPRSQEVIRGTLVIMARRCGKINCRCQRGHKHKSLYLSQSHQGKTCMTYVPRQAEKKVKEAVERYQTIKSELNELSKVNIQLLIKGQLGGKKK